MLATTARPNDGRAGLRVLSADDVRRQPLSLDSHDLVWVDVSQPTAADVAWLEQTFGFHPLALEDVRRRHQRPKLDEYADYAFGVLYAARAEPTSRRIRVAELQFFWGPRYLVTLHTDRLPELEHLAERARSGGVACVAGSTAREVQIADLAYWLIDAVIDSYFPAVDAIAEWSQDVETRMFAPTGRPPQDTLQTIFSLKKDLLALRKVVAPSREVLNALLRREHGRFDEDLQPYFQDVYDHTVRVIDSLDTYRELLASALEAHLTIVSNDVSQTVRKMTAVTAILMVDALVAGVYGMNFEHMPELHWQYGYVWALGLMLGLSVALAVLFRHIRWW